MPPERMSRTFSTPACPLAASPHRYARPMSTALRAERERLDHVGTAAYAAVHDDVDLVTDGLGDRADHPDRRRRAVKVVAAVVGHRDPGDTGVDSAQRVVDPAHALEHERGAPLIWRQVSRIHATSSHVGGGVVIHS